MQFGNNAPKAVRVVLGSHRKLKVNIRIDSYNGRIAASMDFNERQTESEVGLTFGIIGKHAVYFEFLSDEAGEIAEFDCFTFI